MNGDHVVLTEAAEPDLDAIYDYLCERVRIGIPDALLDEFAAVTTLRSPQ